MAAIDGSGPANLHVMRAYMAPLGVALAERLDARAMTLDLDEDDAAMARATGDTESAAAYERLLNVFAPCFDRVSAASAREAAALGERHGLRVDTVPNAVHLPGRIAHRHRADAYQDAPSLLFVGNLTYPPNVEAAQRLAGSILPAVCRLLGHRARATLVGAHDGRLDALQGEDVEVAGFVPDLGPLYANADVVVVPLTSGAGTRIKLLEAFAHGVPAVASHVAAAGLEVEDGCHLLLADDDEMLAELVVRLLRDSRLAAQITDEALRLVQARYSITAVRPAILEFLEGAHPRRGQPSVP